MRCTLESLKLEPKQATAIALGAFDGVHRGHQLLLARARELAQGNGLLSAVLTFWKPPRNYLGQGKRLLLPPEEKLKLLEREVELVVIADFPKLRGLAPEEFARLLRERLHARVVIIGADYRFGRDRIGDAALLRKLGHKHGFRAEIVEKLKLDGEEVSATAIREAIKAGEVERAARLLGRPPLLIGRVVHGTGRGRRLGFPTANLEVPEELAAPESGIFTVWVELPDERRPGVLYIGRRPTFAERERSFEVYILDFAGELYGQELRLHLLRKLREDRKFTDEAALREQIARDVQQAREFFAVEAKAKARMQV